MNLLVAYFGLPLGHPIGRHWNLGWLLTGCIRPTVALSFFSFLYFAMFWVAGRSRFTSQSRNRRRLARPEHKFGDASAHCSPAHYIFVRDALKSIDALLPGCCDSSGCSSVGACAFTGICTMFWNTCPFCHGLFSANIETALL